MIIKKFIAKRFTLLTENAIVLTSLRLLGILRILNRQDATKSEIINFLEETLNVPKFSLETLKLDINSLIKCGFKIKRGTNSNGNKISLEEKYARLFLTKTNLAILKVIKDAMPVFFDYSDAVELQTFYETISELFPNKKLKELSNFNYINIIYKKTLRDAALAAKEGRQCLIYYDSYGKGVRLVLIEPRRIRLRNEKFYLDCYSYESMNLASLRLDNIKWLSILPNKAKGKLKREKRAVKFTVTKEFYDNSPVLEAENVVKVKEDSVVLESFEQEFFLCQRLIEIGKDCTQIDSKRMKKRIIKNLEKTLGRYS